MALKTPLDISTTELNILVKTSLLPPDSGPGPRSALLMRRGRESDPRIEVLQTPALPLRHRAIYSCVVRSVVLSLRHRALLTGQVYHIISLKTTKILLSH